MIRRGYERLTDAEREKIAELYAKHAVTQHDLAKRYRVSAYTIKRAIRAKGVFVRGSYIIARRGITPPVSIVRG